MAATTREYDALVLDRMVPELDGLSLLKALLAAKITALALILTAMGNHIKGSNWRLLRSRFLGKPGPVLQAGDIRLDLYGRKCRRQNREIDLNAKEFRLLEAFMRSGGRVLTRNMLLEKV